MSNSNLVSYVDTSSNKWDERTKPISKITIHHAAGVLSLQEFSNIIHSEREVSWNYAISDDGEIGLYIPEQYRAWTSSSRDNDNVAVTIEVSNSKNKSPWPISDKAYEALLNLCEDICRRNGISSLKYTGDASGNLTMHQYFKETECPGKTLKSKFITIACEVNNRLAKDSSLSYITNPDIISTTAASLNIFNNESPEHLIDYSKFTPYIATISPKSVGVDFKKLKKLGVVAVMIKAGGLYDSLHMERYSYAAEGLSDTVEQANNSKVPFGFLVEVRARNIAEADKELSALSILVRKYAPPLGVWIDIHLTKSVSDNNSIIDRYETIFNRLGLKGKMGIYANKNQLSKIDWNEKRYNSWYLWLNSHVGDTSDMQGLLTPEFFMLNN